LTVHKLTMEKLGDLFDQGCDVLLNDPNDCETPA
jgi:hypothetical protein